MLVLSLVNLEVLLQKLDGNPDYVLLFLTEVIACFKYALILPLTTDSSSFSSSSSLPMQFSRGFQLKLLFSDGITILLSCSLISDIVSVINVSVIIAIGFPTVSMDSNQLSDSIGLLLDCIEESISSWRVKVFMCLYLHLPVSSDLLVPLSVC